jgi:hypothetical protein
MPTPEEKYYDGMNTLLAPVRAAKSLVQTVLLLVIFSRLDVALHEVEICEELAAETPTLVGIDHAFSFPIEYFDRHGLPRDWPNFLLDFQKHWPTHEPHTYIDFIRHGNVGEGSKRMGENTWLRLTERWTATAKSVFLFDVQGSVAKSTFAGLPWLLYLRSWCKRPVHFWPFDGWAVPEGKSVVAEVYPALWMRRFPREGRDGDEQSAFAAAAWLQRVDQMGSLDGFSIRD